MRAFLHRRVLEASVCFLVFVQIPVLHNWLFEVYKHYNDVPFHNFKHCFMVAQMVGISWLTLNENEPESPVSGG